jgi:hypothetical protein
LFLSGCDSSANNIIEEAQSFYVLPFRERYPEMLDAAQKWKPDAYLIFAVVRIRSKTQPGNVKYIVDAYFDSPSTKYESIVISLSQDGLIRERVFIYEVSDSRYEPIAEDDWQIDSSDALDIYLENENVRSFINDVENFCGDMTLERLSYVKEQPVVWRLRISECLTSKVFELYLNSNTGEIFELSDVYQYQ